MKKIVERWNGVSNLQAVKLVLEYCENDARCHSSAIYTNINTISLVEEILTDGSKVYNIELQTTDGLEIEIEQRR